MIDRYAYWTAERLTICVDKASQYLFDFPTGAPIRKRDKNYLVATERCTIPGTMLADKCASCVASWQQIALIKHQAQRSGMRT
jgi:hypothetical protein